MNGYNHDGPAWIAKVKLSKSGKTIYFNNKGLKKYPNTKAEYYDIETGEEYWISNVKKNTTDRHWAGSGKIMIDKSIIEEYQKIIGMNIRNNKSYDIIEIPEVYPIERINRIENGITNIKS